MTPGRHSHRAEPTAPAALAGQNQPLKGSFPTFPGGESHAPVPRQLPGLSACKTTTARPQQIALVQTFPGAFPSSHHHLLCASFGFFLQPTPSIHIHLFPGQPPAAENPISEAVTSRQRHLCATQGWHGLDPTPSSHCSLSLPSAPAPIFWPLNVFASDEPKSRVRRK